ncbi:metal-dependent phosphohydrolase [Embleya sp. NPDC056575]|uniref:HD domain-containing protein n=1 Tax=unclassified Embleya TaxID=2699296 RepID=UPI0036B500D8
MERIQESATVTLRDQWARLVGGHAEAGAVVESLLARYAEPHRRYHDTDHLRTVLDLIGELAYEADDADAVMLAAWFHDAVYDPARADNEERSARLAERGLREAGVAPALVAETARLVRVTAEHAPGEHDHNAHVLCDADLAILAADRERYEAYTAAVREEYAFVPDEAFRAARAAVLRDLMSLPRLFHTRLGAARYEEAARFNMRAELERLEGSIPRQQS